MMGESSDRMESGEKSEGKIKINELDVFKLILWSKRTTSSMQELTSSKKSSAEVFLRFFWVFQQGLIFAKVVPPNEDYRTVYSLHDLCTFTDDVHESGVWEPFHRTKNSEPLLLMSVCNQAHQLAKIGPPTVNIFSFYTKTLKFISDKYRPIDLDMVLYSVTLPNSTQIDPRCWFITKGLRSDCVYYLKKVDNSLKEFYLTDQHVCGIEFVVQEME